MVPPAFATKKFPRKRVTTTEIQLFRTELHIQQLVSLFHPQLSISSSSGRLQPVTGVGQLRTSERRTCIPY